MVPAVAQKTTNIPESSSTTFGRPRVQLLLLNLVLIIATVAVYAPVRNYPFVNYDDPWYVVNNVHIQNGLTGAMVYWGLIERGYCHNWHPLTWMSHALDIQLFGLNAGAHHDMNVVLHIVAALLLFSVLRRATRATFPSFMVAALFAVHPINVESVAWISERKTMLSMIFFLLTFAAYDSYVRKPTNGRFGLVAASYLLGIMAKPQVIMLPVLLLLWDYWPLQRMANSGGSSEEPAEVFPLRSFWQLFGEKVPLFVIGIGSAALTIVAQDVSTPAPWQYAFPLRLENAIVSYAKYVLRALWPAGLAPFYPHPGNSLTFVQVASATLLLLLITVLVFVARRHRYLVVGWLWFLIALLPMIGLIQAWEQGMADRYAYQSFLGLLIMICWGAKEAIAKLRIPAKIATVVAAVVLIVFCIAARLQTRYWADSVAIWTRSLQVTPANNYVAEESLGFVLMSAGRKEEAMPHARKAAQLRPEVALNHIEMAVYEHDRGNLRGAIQQFNLAESSPEATTRQKRAALEQLAKAYDALGDSESARQCRMREAALTPDGPAEF